MSRQGRSDTTIRRENVIYLDVDFLQKKKKKTHNQFYPVRKNSLVTASLSTLPVQCTSLVIRFFHLYVRGNIRRVRVFPPFITFTSQHLSKVLLGLHSITNFRNDFLQLTFVKMIYNISKIVWDSFPNVLCVCKTNKLIMYYGFSRKLSQIADIHTWLNFAVGDCSCITFANHFC